MSKTVITLNLKKGDVFYEGKKKYIVEKTVSNPEMTYFNIMVRDPDGTKELWHRHWRDEFETIPPKEPAVRLALIYWIAKQLGVKVKKV